MVLLSGVIGYMAKHDDCRRVLCSGAIGCMAIITGLQIGRREVVWENCLYSVNHILIKL